MHIKNAHQKCTAKMHSKNAQQKCTAKTRSRNARANDFLMNKRFLKLPLLG
jgi:hypothetical protein